MHPLSQTYCVLKDKNHGYYLYPSLLGNLLAFDVKCNCFANFQKQTLKMKTWPIFHIGGYVPFCFFLGFQDRKIKPL